MPPTLFSFSTRLLEQTLPGGSKIWNPVKRRLSGHHVLDLKQFRFVSTRLNVLGFVLAVLMMLNVNMFSLVSQMLCFLPCFCKFDSTVGSRCRVCIQMVCCFRTVKEAQLQAEEAPWKIHCLAQCVGLIGLHSICLR